MREHPMTWNPTTYLAHAELRERPALELLARVPLENVALAYDLGCGTGNPYLTCANPTSSYPTRRGGLWVGDAFSL